MKWIHASDRYFSQRISSLQRPVLILRSPLSFYLASPLELGEGIHREDKFLRQKVKVGINSPPPPPPPPPTLYSYPCPLAIDLLLLSSHATGFKSDEYMAMNLKSLALKRMNMTSSHVLISGDLLHIC